MPNLIFVVLLCDMLVAYGPLSLINHHQNAPPHNHKPPTLSAGPGRGQTPRNYMAFEFYSRSTIEIRELEALTTTTKTQRRSPHHFLTHLRTTAGRALFLQNDVTPAILSRKFIARQSCSSRVPRRIMETRVILGSNGGLTSLHD